LANNDDLLRPITSSWDIATEFDQMSTLQADLLLLGNATNDTAKAIITMLDGMVFTFDNVVGIQNSLDIQGDIEKNRAIHWTLTGAVAVSSLYGLVS